jgi:hypothetical protein
MSLEIAEELAQLRKRVERLEARPKGGRTNQIGAAKYLNRSEEWLRQRHARGEGPRRTKHGRFWSYSYADLDEFAETIAL